jgi:phage-Barnase-EndoU-ColicinE5/D-RelE like nuclease3
MKSALKAASRMWDHTGHQIHDFGLVSDVEAISTKRTTGIDLAGFRRFMATRGVRHVKRNHTNQEREACQQQVPVVPRDFVLIPNNTTIGNVTLIGNNGSRKPLRLEYRAKIDERVYVYVETIGVKDKRLELWTMRIEQLSKWKV